MANPLSENAVQPASPPARREPSAEPAPVWQTWALLFVLSLSLYAATANRGIQWQDSGHRILRVVTKDLDGGLGLALSHPLHHWLGRLAAWPGWGTPALAVTLVSAFAGAIAVANVYGCVRTITGNARAGLFAAASLAIAHTFWQMATITETYTLVAALLAGELWCLAAFVQGNRRCLFGMFLLNGLGVANHLLAGFTTPILIVVAIIAWRDRRVTAAECAAAAGLWVLGSLPYSGLVLVHWLQTGDFVGTLRSALFGSNYAKNVLNTGVSAGLLARAAAFVIYNFPNLLLPAAVLGMLRARRLGVAPAIRWALLAALVIHVGFVFRYNIKDQQTFFLPTYVLLSIFGGIGAACVLQWPASFARRAAVVAALLLFALTPVIYAITPPIARHYRVLDPYSQRPFRDSYVYFFTPWSVADRSAEQMSRTALDLAGPDGVILYEDLMAGFALEYKVIEANREDITVASLPRLHTEEGRTRFLELIRQPDGSYRQVVFVPTDVRKVKTEVLPGMKWVPRDNLYVLAANP